MPTITLGTSKAGVVVSHNLDRWIRDAVRAAGGVTIEEIERAGREVYNAAKERWPVGERRPKGPKPASVPHSKALFREETQLQPARNRVRYTIINGADWTFFVRSTQVDPTGNRKLHAWTELVRKPLEAKARELAVELGPKVARVMSR